jgi:hypothetical protein
MQFDLEFVTLKIKNTLSFVEFIFDFPTQASYSTLNDYLLEAHSFLIFIDDL